MHGVRLIPRNLVGFFVEQRAGQIQDPVARLRFLQGSMGLATGRPALHATKSSHAKRFAMLGLALLFGSLLIPKFKASSGSKGPLPPHTIAQFTAQSQGVTMPDVVPNVWLVDQAHEFETFSNGLRIDDRYVKPNDKRVFYPVYQRGSIDAAQPVWRSEPAGIVYHTTESDQARFTPDQNARLKRIAKAVIGVVRQNHSYHFLIDRFGQVFRIVPEGDVANHAGYSVWAEGNNIFVNLNSSFLGIAFETQTQLGDMPSANPAQVHAARILTEMLRSKYHIPQSNCVTHAQVSVNPDNMLVGYHTDWAGNFPFHEIGLKRQLCRTAAQHLRVWVRLRSYIHARNRRSPLARSGSGRRSDANAGGGARHPSVPLQSHSSKEIQGGIGGAPGSGHRQRQ